MWTYPATMLLFTGTCGVADAIHTHLYVNVYRCGADLRGQVRVKRSKNRFCAAS